MIKRIQVKESGETTAPAPRAVFERPQPIPAEHVAVIAALLETELKLSLGGVDSAWTFPVAAAGHGWSETGRLLVVQHERGIKP
jgi:hypothetical protein